MWIKNNPWKSAGIAIVLIYVIIATVKRDPNPMNWFSAVPGTQRGRGTTNVGVSEAGLSCCNDTNPCGKSSSWFNKNCGGNI